MIPENRLSTTILSSTFLSPDLLVTSQVVDYERGGVALDDGTQGLDVQDWIAYIDGDDLKVGTTLENGVVIITRPGTTTLSLGFDLNMRATLAYTQAGVVKLWWFDTLQNMMVDTEFADTSWPRLCTDDKRALQTQATDIILAYIKDGDLYYRQQRDRYSIERLLGTPPLPVLVNIGMNTVNRLQFQFR